MIGTTLQNYTIEALIGEGGMGKVYKAIDNTLGRTVAIKSLNASLTNQPAFQERFKNEAKTLARLTHPNIAVIYNYIQDRDDYYMVMEFVEGKNMDEIMHQTNPLPYQVVVPVMTSVLDGLEHAHRKGVLHRDIKPANIMLTPESAVKLMDFGIAKVSDQVKLTQVSRLIGTLEFLAPELIEGNDPSPASDIYATGVTMYEMLTGKLPFTGKSDYMLMQEIVKEKPVMPDNWNNLVPENLSDIILKSLDKKPGNRFKTSADFAQALRNAFPELKSLPIDFVRSHTAKPIVAPAINTGVSLQPTTVQPGDIAKPAPPATTLLSESPATKLADIKKKEVDNSSFFQKNKLAVIGAIVLLIIGFTLFKVFSDGNKKTENSAIADSTQSTPQTQSVMLEDNPGSNTNNDSLSFALNDKKQEDSIDNIEKIIVQKEIKPTSNKKPTTQNKESEKPKPSEDKPEESKPEVKPQKVEEDNNDNASTNNIKEPISLRGRGVPVTLMLRENLSKETAHEGDPVSFKVVEPGLYKDEVLIPQGSVVNGTIKGIGVIRMSIIFNSITIRGRNYHLSKSEAGASKETVLSGRSFKSSIKGIISP